MSNLTPTPDSPAEPPVTTRSPKNRSTHSRALGAGLTLAVSVGLFAYFGLWLDARFGTRPWLLLVCVGCGIVGGILHLIRVLAPEQWPFGKSSRPGDRSP
jgi:F0F1-type ATP synthase assembly protein I